MNNEPRYPIGTLIEMAAIPSEARDRFLAELPFILEAVATLVDRHKAINAEFEGVAEIQHGIPEWIDDGLGQRTVTVRSGEMVASNTAPIGEKL